MLFFVQLINSLQSCQVQDKGYPLRPSQSLLKKLDESSSYFTINKNFFTTTATWDTVDATAMLSGSTTTKNLVFFCATVWNAKRREMWEKKRKAFWTSFPWILWDRTELFKLHSVRVREDFRNSAKMNVRESISCCGTSGNGSRCGEFPVTSETN